MSQTNSPTNGSQASQAVSTSSPLALRSALSTAVSRLLFASEHGFDSFDGNRDLYKTLGYKLKISLQAYRQRYRRGGIAKRIVNAMPREAWAGGVDIIENEDVEVRTEFEQDISTLFEDNDVITRMLRIDILAGLGQYALGIIGVDDGKELSVPLTKRVGQKVIYLTPIIQERARIKSYEENKSSKRFGRPLIYGVNFNRSKSSGVKEMEDVHWTRVLHHVHNPLDDDIFGDPDLEDVYNLFDDLYKLIGGGSEAAWKQMVSKTLFDIDKDVTLAGTETEKKEIVKQKEEELEEMVNGLRQFMMTRGVTPKTFGATVYDFSSNANTVVQHIAGTKGLPVRYVMGSERGELASVTDRDMVKNRVTEHCNDHAIPLVRQFVDRMIEYGFVRPPTAKKYKVVMGASISTMSEKERAELAVLLTQANLNQKRAGQPPVTSDSEIRDKAWSLKALPASKVDEEPNADPVATADPAPVEGAA